DTAARVFSRPGIGEIPDCLRKLAFAVVEIKPVGEGGIAGFALDTTAHNEEIEIAVSVDVDEERTEVLVVGHLAERGAHPHREDRLALCIEAAVEEKPPGLAFGPAEIEVVETVTVHVAPRLAGPELGMLMGQERLPDEVIKGRLGSGDGRES